MNNRIRAAVTGLAIALAAGLAHAQVPQYGPNITLDQAKKAIAAADAEARKNGWPVAIAIVDTAGMLVAFQRHENTQTASISVAQDKAVSAAMYRRSTKVFQDALAGGGAAQRILTLRYANAVDGGDLIIVDGKIVGAIGVSGVTPDQDGQTSRAGAAAFK